MTALREMLAYAYHRVGSANEFAGASTRLEQLDCSWQLDYKHCRIIQGITEARSSKPLFRHSRGANFLLV